MLLHATSVRRAGLAGGTPFASVALDAEQRHLRRKVLALRNGDEVLVDFDRAVRLDHGDHLVLDDGRLVEVLAAAEELCEVRGRDGGHLLRLAWHIGNRHLEAQIEPGRILVRRDRVIARMLEGLGAGVRDVREPFAPEPGAYHAHAP